MIAAVKLAMADRINRGFRHNDCCGLSEIPAEPQRLVSSLTYRHESIVANFVADHPLPVMVREKHIATTINPEGIGEPWIAQRRTVQPTSKQIGGFRVPLRCIPDRKSLLVAASILALSGGCVGGFEGGQ